LDATQVSTADGHNSRQSSFRVPVIKAKKVSQQTAINA